MQIPRGYELHDATFRSQERAVNWAGLCVHQPTAPRRHAVVARQGPKWRIWFKLLKPDEQAGVTADRS